MELNRQLQRCVRDGMQGFTLVYQPLVRADGLGLTGAEALLRWSCPDTEDAGPAQFIPLLENSGLMIEAGKWILDQAFSVCKRWLLYCPDFIMHINVSYLQFIDKDFVPTVVLLLEKYHLDAQHIVLELTESYFVTDMPALKETLQRLRQLHIRIAMDDFGTGYSSLGMLSQTPADIVKIDRVFISFINDRDHVFNHSFIGAVIKLCHSVGIAVCVEGVEHPGELEAVCSLEADSIQGFYISKPIPADQFEEKYWKRDGRQ